jgi:site-specific recombinase XerD
MLDAAAPGVPSGHPTTLPPRLAVVGGTDTVLDALQVLDAQAQRFRAAARSSNTVQAYQRDWRHFTAWCAGHQLVALPATPATLTRYLSVLAQTLRPATIARRLVAIAQAHASAGHPSPTTDAGVREVWKGLCRELGTRQVGKAPLLTADVRALVSALPEGLAGTRDRALLLAGFAGAFRRSELVALDVADVELVELGAIVTVRRSKTDQAGLGRQVPLPRGEQASTCPVRALAAWLTMLRAEHGPIFRSVDRWGRLSDTRLSGRDVARIVKRAAVAAGLDATHYAGHSLRSGLATSAAAAGVAERDIMRQTGHRSVEMVRRYIRAGELFTRSAAASVGL